MVDSARWKRIQSERTGESCREPAREEEGGKRASASGPLCSRSFTASTVGSLSVLLAHVTLSYLVVPRVTTGGGPLVTIPQIFGVTLVPSVTSQAMTREYRQCLVSNVGCAWGAHGWPIGDNPAGLAASLYSLRSSSCDGTDHC